MKTLRWVMIAFALAPHFVFSANELEYKWPAGELHFSTGDLATTSVGPLDWESAFELAGQRWSTTTTIKISSDGLTQGATCETTGPNSAFFAANFCGSNWGSTTLAVARTVSIANGPDAGQAIHTDVIFNSTKTWGVDDLPANQDPVDFTRVAVHEVGHSLGLDHSDDPNAIMWFQIGDTTAPLTDDVVGMNRIYGAVANQLIALGRVNANGSDDLAVFLLDPTTRRNIFYVKDGNTDTVLSTIDTGTDPVLAVASVPKILGNGNEALAVLGIQSSGAIRSRIYDATNGSLISQSAFGNIFSGIDITGLADTNSNGNPDIAVLGVNPNGTARVQIRDSATGVFIRNVSFGTVGEAIRIRQIADIDGNGNAEIAVLSMQLSGQSRVQIRDSVTGLIVTNIFNGASYRSVDFDVLEDINNSGGPEVATLGVGVITANEGKIRVQIKDATSGNLVFNAFFGAKDLPRRIVAVPDANQNTVADFAVLLERKSDSLLRVKVKDGQTNALIKSLSFAQAGNGLDLEAVGDQDNDGSPDILVLGNKDGQFRTMQKDAASGATTNQTNFP